MKKFALIIAACSIGISLHAHAQSTLKPLQSDQGVHKPGVDTVTNAGTIAQIVQIPGYNDLVTIQAAVTKLTGTPAGSLKLYASVDGLKYDFATTATDTLAVTNVSALQVKTWKIVPSSFQYYKLVYKGAGTQTSTVSSNALIRRK